MTTETTIPIKIRVVASNAVVDDSDHATAPEMFVPISLHASGDLVFGSVSVFEIDGRWCFDPEAQCRTEIFSDELLEFFDRFFDDETQSDLDDLRSAIEKVAAKEASEAASRPRIKTVADAMDIWHKVNDAGDGYSVGEEGDSPTEAADREKFTTFDVDATGTCLVRDRTGQLVLIGDVNGPWACLIG